MPENKTNSFYLALPYFNGKCLVSSSNKVPDPVADEQPDVASIKVEK